MSPVVWILLATFAAAALFELADRREPPRWTARVLEGGTRSWWGR